MLRVVVIALLAALSSASASADGFAGRWNARITDVEGPFSAAGFEVAPKADGLAVTVVWRTGSALPAKAVEAKDGVLRFEREATPGRVDHFEARASGDALTGEARLADGSLRHFEGKRAPDLASTGEPRWGKPVTLFDGKSLTGWALRDPQARNGWAVVDGTLAVVEPKGNVDLVTAAKFQDLKVHVEFNLEPGSNSGVYLRGRYEIQILDDASKATEALGCGALYSRIAPRVDATRPAGEWQSFDLTLVGRRLTVVLNGQPVVDNAVVEGITGGAESPFEGEPGPLMLQGDHGKVRFRNIVVTPAR